MAMKVPEQHRVKTGPFATTTEYGCAGLFVWNVNDRLQIRCIVSDGMGWEHVSVTVMHRPGSDPRIVKERCPTWEEMCQVKDAFWDERDCVIQYHPPKSEYVSHNDYCLHLWRPVGITLPLPPSIMVGPDSSKKK